MRAKHIPLLLAAVLITALTIPTSARAQQAETVLVPTSGGLGATMPDIAARMTAVISRVAAAHGLTPKQTDASRDDVFAVAGCTGDDEPCHQAVLRTLGAKTLILAHVTPGTGTVTAEVELVVATRGKASIIHKMSLSSTTTERLVAELEAAAPPAFGGRARTPGGVTPPDPPDDTPVPPDNNAPDNTLDPGEGDPFSSPTGDASEKPISPFDAPPDDTTTETPPPTSGPIDSGGLDWRQVSGTSWAIGGAGAGLVVTSFFFFGAAGSKQGEIDDARANTIADIERIRDLEGSGKTLATLGNTTFLIGLVGLGVGGYLIYRDARRGGQQTDVAVAPMVLPSGVGLGVTVWK